MPAVPQPADLTKAQWDYIVSTLNTEKASGGRLNGCQWTDAAGNARTSSIVDVRRSHHLFTSSLDPKKIDPRTAGVVGVQLISSSINPYASNRRMMVNEFRLLIAVNSVTQTIGSDQLLANGDDALSQAWAFVSDGNGNGIGEIFREQTNYTLGGSALSMNITGATPILDPQPGDTPQIWAYIEVAMQTQQIVAL